MIQEELKKADKNKKVYVTCTIGISTGKFRTFQTPEGARDYIGSVVDRAARLGAAASPMAIFVDRSTINSAMMINVKSKLGELLNWGVDDYTGNQQKISLKGFSQPVLYHEIKWDQQLYGIKSDVVTDAAESQVKHVASAPQPTAAATVPVSTTNLTSIVVGTVKNWQDDRNFGFIIADGTRDEFYTKREFLANKETLTHGQQVIFVPHPPIGNTKHHMASLVVVLEETCRGTITRITDREPSKQLATICVFDENGSKIEFFAFLASNPQKLKKGDNVEFVASLNDKGPKATQVSTRPI